MALPRSTVVKVNEWVTWFNWHADKVDGYSLEAKMKWMLKAINGAYECLTLVAEDINSAQRRAAGIHMERGIIVPKSWKWEGRNASSGR